uniref:Uncharacterized protein n=1 Tax=Biomphalaria glabrata TaxID=6526 RepID=A0A2C9LE42_BIOGL
MVLERQLDLENEHMDVADHSFMEKHKLDTARNAAFHGLNPELIRRKLENDPRKAYWERRLKRLPKPVTRRKTKIKPKFTGWDCDKPLADHLWRRLPREQDNALHLLRFLERRSDSKHAFPDTQNEERVKTPSTESRDYILQFGLHELFEVKGYLTSKLLADQLSGFDSSLYPHLSRQISPTDQNAQERHTCQKDVPPEALIPQIHQTILSPSASHIRNILSDATYPLGLRSKRRFQGRATSLHKIRSDILSILDDSEVQRLENIFWNSKKGWARTSFLEDELRAFLKAKALEKKGRQRVSIVSPDVFPIPEITGKKKKLQTKEATNAGSLFKRESKTRSLRHMSMKDQGKPKEILLRRKITEGELEALSLLEEGSSSIFGTDSMSTMLSESVCSKYAPILSTRQGGKKTDMDAKKKKDAQDDKRAAKAKGSKMQFRRTSDPDDKYDKKWKARGEVSDSRRESKDLLRRDSKSQFKRGIWFDEDGAISRAVREQLQKIKPLDYSDDRQPVFVEDEDTKDSKVEKESETDKRKKRKKPHGTLAPDVLSEWEKSGLSTPSRQSLSAFGQPLARRRGGSANSRASSLSKYRIIKLTRLSKLK